MSLDPSKICIISAKKIDPKKLIEVGDSAVDVPKVIQKQNAGAKRCNMCCVAYGSIIAGVTTTMLTGFLTGLAIHFEKRVLYTVNGVMRQTMWMAFPGYLVGATLHYFLSEAMWSAKRNSWGQAWAKAIFFNSLFWVTAIGAGTFLWRRLLPITAAGRRLYYRYPSPSTGVEVRVLRGGREFFTGMGWSYWLCGVGFGQLGLATVAVFCCATDRPFLMMAPQGGYARRCMPPWRREQFALMSNTQGDKNVS